MLDELEKDLKNIYDINEKLTTQNQSLLSEKEELEHKLNKKLDKEKNSNLQRSMEVEGLNEKIKILQNSLDNYAKNLDMKERTVIKLT